MNCLASKITPCSGKLAGGYCSKHYSQVTRRGKVYLTNRDSRPAKVYRDRAEIPLGLHAKDGYTTVDRKFAYLAEDNWRISAYGYAIRSKDKVFMHRLLLEPSSGEMVDHKNGDKLDNRLENIRICTQPQNAMNQKRNSVNTTGYKGVTVASNGFRARIKVNYKSFELGVFDTAKKAALAYNRAAKKLHGDFARLNDVR